MIELKPKFWHYFGFIEHVLNIHYRKFVKRNDNKIIKLYFNEALSAMRMYWKNTKFVILLFPEEYNNYEFCELSCWKELENNFIIINVNELTNKKMETYKAIDNGHPSAEAWDIILDKLLDYLKIDVIK